MKQRVNVADGEPIGVYILETPSGKVYVGMTCDSFERRWHSHLKELRRGIHRSKGLQRSYDKYGWDNISKTIIKQWEKPPNMIDLLTLEKEILLEERVTWERIKNSGKLMLHSCPSGTGSILHTKESKAKLSKALKGKNFKFNPDVNDFKIVLKNLLVIKIIANHYSVCEATILRCMDRYDLHDYLDSVFSERILDLYKEGIYPDEIAKSVKVKKDKIYTTLIENGIVVNAVTADAETLRKMYWDDKMSAREIGEQFGMSSQTIRNRMRKNNIPLRQERHNFSKIALSPETVRKLYWDDNVSTKIIGEMFGASRTSVRLFMRRNNIPIRAPGEHKKN